MYVGICSCIHMQGTHIGAGVEGHGPDTELVCHLLLQAGHLQRFGEHFLTDLLREAVVLGGGYEESASTIINKRRQQQLSTYINNNSQKASTMM